MSVATPPQRPPLLAIGIEVPPGEDAEGWGRLRFGSLRLRGLTVAQFPNAAIAIWMVSTVTARVTSGTAESIALAVATVALIAWAYLELTDGANWFRRLLGVAVLAYVIVKLASVLPG